MSVSDQIISYSFSVLKIIFNFSASTYGILVLISLVFGIFQYMRWKKESKEKEADLRKWAKDLKKKHNK
ncbi:MAG: hypothetical protein WCV81_03525 [Microgenomates group bacterium]|jgi:hypothetical protein